MQNKKNIIINALVVVLGLVLALTPYKLFPVCSKLSPMGIPMKCHYTGLLLVFSGIGIVVIGLLAILVNNKKMNALTGIIVAVVATLDYLIPTGVIKVGHWAGDMSLVKAQLAEKNLQWAMGFCGNGQHGCAARTLPAIKVILPILLILGIFLLISSFLTKEEA